MKDIPPSLREAIEAVGQDRTHGAAWLAREAANVMARTARAALARGVVTASAGNMAQGVGGFWSAHYTRAVYPVFYEHFTDFFISPHSNPPLLSF